MVMVKIKGGFVEITQCSVFQGVVVGNMGTHGDFHFFKSGKEKRAQQAVKVLDTHYSFKGCTLPVTAVSVNTERPNKI